MKFLNVVLLTVLSILSPFLIAGEVDGKKRIFQNVSLKSIVIDTETAKPLPLNQRGYELRETDPAHTITNIAKVEFDSYASYILILTHPNGNKTRLVTQNTDIARLIKLLLETPGDMDLYTRGIFENYGWSMDDLFVSAENQGKQGERLNRVTSDERYKGLFSEKALKRNRELSKGEYGYGIRANLRRVGDYFNNRGTFNHTAD